MKRTVLSIAALVVAVGAAGVVTLLSTNAATPVTVTADFAQLDNQPNFYHYERSHIKIQRTSGADEQALADIGTTHERSFVRLDKWKPTLNAPLNTDPGSRFDLGDRYIESANRRDISIWVTQEVSLWKEGLHDDYFLNPPFSNQELQQYEQVWYEIVRYIKEQAPNTQIVEMMNEPNLGKFNLTEDDQWKLYVANANVVNQINADLNLPNAEFGEKLISGGPSFIYPAHDPPNGGDPKFRNWIDKIYEQPNFEEIKPAFYSFHRFNPSAQPERYGFDPQIIREYMNDPKFNGAWDDVPLWVSAYNNYHTQTVDQDPSAVQYSRTAAGVAAVHYQYMKHNVEFSSFFAQSAYNAPEGSVLLPEGTAYDISYYRRGAKTAVYNYFDMMSRIDGQRVQNTIDNPSPLTNGMGVGVDAIRGNNKAWVLAWNYHNTSNSATHERTVTFDLSNLDGAGIDIDEDAVARIYAIDTVNSNIAAGNHQADDLKLVNTINLNASANRSIDYTMPINSVLLIEIEGDDVPVDPPPVGDPLQFQAERAILDDPASRQPDPEANLDEFVEF